MERLPETCTDVQAALPLYVGSDLEPMEQAAVAEHLEACAGCSVLAERAQQAREVLWALRGEYEGPSPDLWHGIRAQLVSEGFLKLAPTGDVPVTDEPARVEPGRELSRPVSAGPHTGRPSPWIRRTLQTGGLAAAAALALFVGLHDRRPGPATTDPATPGVAQGEPTGLVQADPVPEDAVRPVANGLRLVGATGPSLLSEAEVFPAAVFPVSGVSGVNALTGSESSGPHFRPISGRDPRVR